MAKDTFKVLKEDHRKVEGLFEKLLGTTERAEKTRQELFEELRDSLEMHAELEEHVLYPLLESPEETHKLALESEEEHAVVKKLLAELDSEPKDTEA